MLTDKQRKVFEDLLRDPNFRGRKSLNHLLWLNTTEPNFKKGECFLVSDRGRRIYGYPVRDFHARIVEISTWRDHEEYHYKLEGVVKCSDNGKQTYTTFFASESELTQRCEDNITVLGECKDECPDMVEVTGLGI